MDPPMVADVGIFQVADVPMYGYIYTLLEKANKWFPRYQAISSLIV